MNSLHHLPYLSRGVERCYSVVMDIALIIYGNLDIVSGGYYYDRMLVRALEGSGHRVTVTNPKEASQIDHNLDLVIIDELCHPNFTRPSDFAALPPRRATVAMVHHLALDEGLGMIHRIRQGRMERRFFSFINFCIYNSPQTAESVRTKTGYRGPGVIALPGRQDGGSVDSPTRTTVPPLRLCFIGNVIRRKGLHLLIDALKTMTTSDIELTVVGKTDIEPEYFQKLEKNIIQNGLAKRIQFLGYMDEQCKENILSKTHAMVMPSSHEGFGIAYLEAMRYGCVPVASSSGGAAEFIQNTFNGFLINTRNCRDLISVLEILKNNDGLRNSMAASARSHWEEHPTWKQCFANAIEELETLR